MDTQVLFDVLLGDPRFSETSAAALDQARRAGSLIISEVVYAELATRFPSRDELARFLEENGITVAETTRETFWNAGKAWQRYAASRKGTQQVQCPRCGASFLCACVACGHVLSWRQHVMADFLIGAHAETHADRLMTRDVAYFRRWFPKLALYDPSASSGEPGPAASEA